MVPFDGVNLEKGSKSGPFLAITHFLPDDRKVYAARKAHLKKCRLPALPLGTLNSGAYGPRMAI